MAALLAGEELPAEAALSPDRFGRGRAHDAGDAERRAQELPDGATVEAAVTATGAPADGRGVAVALDGEVVPRGVVDHPVREGQQVEVLHAVQEVRCSRSAAVSSSRA